MRIIIRAVLSFIHMYLLSLSLTGKERSLKRDLSLRAEISENANQLRDTNIFTDISEQMYMLYTVAGENSISITSLQETE